MSKRNKIFRNIRAHLKKEFDLDDATARSFAKQALSKYRSSGSKAIERTSEYCTTDLPAITCDSSSKYRTIEGLCNNLNSPYLGAFDAAFIREREVDPYFAKDITISDPSKYPSFFHFVKSKHFHFSIILSKRYIGSLLKRFFFILLQIIYYFIRPQ